MRSLKRYLKESPEEGVADLFALAEMASTETGDAILRLLSACLDDIQRARQAAKVNPERVADSLEYLLGAEDLLQWILGLSAEARDALQKAQDGRRNS